MINNSQISLTQFQEMTRGQSVSNKKGTYITSSGVKTLDKDTCSFSRDIVTVITGQEDEYDSGVLKTKVNNKDGHLKLSEPQKKEAWIEGDIEGKEFLMHKTDNQYQGHYGGKEFDLSIDVEAPPSNIIEKFFTKKSPNNYSHFNVSGTLDGKPVSIKMPNAKIPENEDFKDILSLVLWTKHQKAKTIGGEIKTIQFSNDGFRHKQEQEEIDEKSKEKFWQNPVIQTGLTILTTLGISWLTKKLL